MELAHIWNKVSFVTSLNSGPVSLTFIFLTCFHCHYCQPGGRHFRNIHFNYSTIRIQPHVIFISGILKKFLIY